MANIPDEAIDTSHEVSHAAFKLYASYCRHRNNKHGHPHFGLAWPGREIVHDETGICTTYISQLKMELVERGWIETIGKKVRLLRGFYDSSEKSNGSTFQPAPESTSFSPKFDDSTEKKNGRTEKKNGSTRINKVIEPAKEPSNEPEQKTSVVSANADPTPLEGEQRSTSRASEADEIFNYWKQERRKNSRTIFDAKRRQPSSPS